MNQAINVIVVERESLYRRGLVSSLDTIQDITVVGDAAEVSEGYRLADEELPDVALLGTTLLEAPGIQLANEIRRRFPSIATIVLSATETDDELFAAIRAGAAAYCGRDLDEELLHEIIRRAASGEYVINEQLLNKPSVAARVLDHFRASTQPPLQLSGMLMPLSNREFEILKQVGNGLTNAEIGYVLGISAQTVKNHITSILRKLAVNDRTQAVVTALKLGWISIDDDDDFTQSGITSTPTSRMGSEAV